VRNESISGGRPQRGLYAFCGAASVVTPRELLLCSQRPCSLFRLTDDLAHVSDNRIVVVSGPPASGKTTLAERLATDFSLPLIAKDGIKEALFEGLGTSDRAWSERLGRGSFAVLWHLVEVELAAGRSFLVEGNFHADSASAMLDGLRQRFAFTVLEIHCLAPVEILYQRYKLRIGDRHPGHADSERLADFLTVFDAGRYRLQAPDQRIVLDTTTFDEFDYNAARLVVHGYLTALR
jgi:predicted kinase